MRRRLGRRLGLGPWAKEDICSGASVEERMGKGASPKQHAGSGFLLVLQNIWMRLPRERISLISPGLAVFVP